MKNALGVADDDVAYLSGSFNQEPDLPAPSRRRFSARRRAVSQVISWSEGILRRHRPSSPRICRGSQACELSR